MTRSLLVLGLALAACSNKLNGGEVGDDRHPPVDPADTDVGPVDGDGDGVTDETDCDDANPNIFPGSPEVCDGLDDDCDGSLAPFESDQDGDGVVECEEECGPMPGAGTTTILADCEYLPSASGTPFLPRVEWNMTQSITDPATGTVLPAYVFADDADYTSIFQAPVVSEATDDDGDGNVTAKDTPDIAVVMADTNEDTEGVLRLISGDGTSVLASAHWQAFTNANGTANYAPYHYAGVAMANIDADDAMEIATLVIRDTDGACYPASYEVDDVGGQVDLVLEQVYGGAAYSCMAHAPAISDLDDDGEMELIYGRAVFEGDTFVQKWYGDGGRGWFGRGDYPTDGYWNSGYHSFAYDVDGDGQDMEVVAGRTVYTSDGGTYCALGHYDGTTWVDAVDGYPAIADIARFAGDTEGEPEIVITGNESVAVYHGTPAYDPNGLARCLLIDELPNDPLSDPTLPSGLPTPAQCDATAISFGGPPTIADFDGDGVREIGVAGSCWYSLFRLDTHHNLERYALTNTRDWSSASTGSTVFDFNGDGQAEVVFSDEQALYVWHVDTSAGLDPWERLQDVLYDENHKSWTIHEYPLVADVDNDGKAEIVVVNSHLPPDHEDAYGIYVLGAADDDWVSARNVWNQHAYYVTNVDDRYLTGFSEPNYAPFTPDDYNSFRQQAPGEFGALQAVNLRPVAKEVCQEGCGDLIVRVQVVNDSAHVTADSRTVIAVWAVSGTSRDLVEAREIGWDLAPATVSDTYEFAVPSAMWSTHDNLEIVVDDPDVTGLPNGAAAECNEGDNTVTVPITGACE